MEQGAPAGRRFGSALFWRVFAVINLVAVGWVGWVIWQITPRPVVHDFVLRLPVSQRTASDAIPLPAAPTGMATVVPVAPPVPIEEISIQSGQPMTPLRLETEIKLPAKSNQPVIGGQ